MYGFLLVGDSFYPAVFFKGLDINDFTHYGHKAEGDEDEDDGVAPFSLPDEPWSPPCGSKEYKSCFDCPKLCNDQFHFDCELGHDVSDLIDPNAHCAFDVR